MFTVLEFAQRDKREKNEMLVTGMQHGKGMKLLRKYHKRLESQTMPNSPNLDTMVDQNQI